MAQLLINGRIYSPFARDASAMLVEDGVIGWIGDDASAATFHAEQVIDLQGALVTPGFVDAHVHATDTGLSLTGLDLAGAPSLAAALVMLERAARAVGGRPILGSGWDETTWPEQRPPTAAELDRAAYGGVVYLARTDAHSAVVSSALLASVAGISSLPGYHPSGHLITDAHHAARSVALSSITGSRLSELQLTALRHAASLGVVAVHEMAGPEISGEADLTNLLRLADDPELPAVLGYWGELGAAAKARELGARGAGGDLFLDGSIGSHTAAMSRSYLDADTTGYLRFETAEVAEHILSCTAAGLQAGFHAIGDAATSQVVDAMRLAADRDHRVTTAGHRVEHAELISDVAAFATAGLTASVQPAFDATWGGNQGMYAHRLGRDRAARLNPLAALAAQGVPLALGSDAPVTPVAPWAAVRAAAYPHHGEHAITPRAALIAHTRGGWRAARADGDGHGVLTPGAPASFAVFEAGELAVDAPDRGLASWSTDERSGVPGLPDLAPGVALPRCLRTVRAGTVLYDSGELP
ncbi:MAG TPA: amidohydrolase family protein [Jatrophihabitans sp.]|nr:amidohydrolase family protein [Jatrophihabitans sp.]